MSAYEEFATDELKWYPIEDERLTPAGIGPMEFGLPEGIGLNQPYYVEGYEVVFASVPVRSQSGGQYAMPCLVLSLPADYPKAEGGSFLIPFSDAHRLLQNMRSCLIDGEKALAEQQRAIDRALDAKRPELAKATQDATRCAYEGCRRQRRFFEGGVGYCKHHANVLGIRPKGKVT